MGCKGKLSAYDTMTSILSRCEWRMMQEDEAKVQTRKTESGCVRRLKDEDEQQTKLDVEVEEERWMDVMCIVVVAAAAAAWYAGIDDRHESRLTTHIHDGRIRPALRHARPHAAVVSWACVDSVYWCGILTISTLTAS